MGAIQIEAIWAGLKYNGRPLSSGLVFTYESGTIIPKITWTTPDKSVQSTNPIILDYNGRALVFAEGNYRFVITDRFGDEVIQLDGLAYGGGLTTTEVTQMIENAARKEVKLKMRLFTTQTIPANSGYTIIRFDTLDIDNYNGFNPANGLYIIPFDGFYTFNVNVMANVKLNQRVSIGIGRNNNFLGTMTHPDDGGSFAIPAWEPMSAFSSFFCNTGDFIAPIFNVVGEAEVTLGTSDLYQEEVFWTIHGLI